MSEKPQPGSRKKPGEAPTPEQAREAILAKLHAAGTKGTGTPATAKSLTANRTAFAEALAALENEGIMMVDRSRTKPKFHLREFAPAVPTPREAILARLRDAGAKGAGTFATATTSAIRRAAIEQALAALESERAVVADRRKQTPKYYLAEFAPRFETLENVCSQLEEVAAASHPQLLSAPELKRRLAKAGKPLFQRACYCLLAQGQLLQFQHGRTTLFASGRALRSMLGAPAGQTPAATESTPISGERISEAYHTLAAQSGFPAVKIAALQRATGVPLEALRRWLIAEYREGRADFSFGDWSLSDETTRGAAVEIRGERYLLVQLQP